MAWKFINNKFRHYINSDIKSDTILKMNSFTCFLTDSTYLSGYLLPFHEFLGTAIFPQKPLNML